LCTQDIPALYVLWLSEISCLIVINQPVGGTGYARTLCDYAQINRTGLAVASHQSGN